MFRIKIFIFSLALFLSCGKKEQIPGEGTGLRIDVLGSASEKTTSNGIPTIWTDLGKSNTTFIPFNNEKIALRGAHELLISGGRNLIYFGTEIISGAARIVLFTYEGKKVLSEDLELSLRADKDENLYAHHIDSQGNLYLFSTGQTTSFKSISYVYKIDNLLGLQKIEMPVDIPFAVFKTSTGLMSVKAIYMNGGMEINLGKQLLGLERIWIDMNGYAELMVHSAYYNHMDRLILLTSSKRKEDNKSIYFLINIDPKTKKIMRHMLKLSNENYQFGKGIMEGNILFVPGSNRSSNQAFYLRIDTQTDLNEVSVVRSDLEVDPQYPLTQALFIQRIDGNIYVGGVQFGKACYWKDGKILSLESDPKIIRSYPIQFLPYRN